jgi:hypothetical protein
MTCRIALKVGSIVCSCVLTQKGTTLKAIVVNLLNLSNINSYRHSLGFFLCQSSYYSRATLPEFHKYEKKSDYFVQNLQEATENFNSKKMTFPISDYGPHRQLSHTTNIITLTDTCFLFILYACYVTLPAKY